MRKYYIDNIRWITIILVVIYHVIYMFNGIATAGVTGPFHEKQYQDSIQYILYPWFMILLFILAGMNSRYYLENHTIKEFVRSRTRKLLVPSTIGLLVFGWIQGYMNMLISDAFHTMPDTIPGFAMYFIMAVSGTGVLWFIQMLWIFSILLALIRKYEKGRHLHNGAFGHSCLPVRASFKHSCYLRLQILNLWFYFFSGLFCVCPRKSDRSYQQIQNSAPCRYRLSWRRLSVHPLWG
ncbi:hypothetical protein C819_01132 [Lachnospiraceae bacterium 10-1]|nr:hypothetical protein C819_01132 [Lachnospiraceae bacterium 10-1]